MAYNNSDLQVHGPGITPYHGQPSISINISVGNVTRSGSTLSCPITKCSINGVNGYDYFGYNIEISAQLDNGSRKTLVTKPYSPSQWSSGDFAMSSTTTLTSTNNTTSCSLKIYFKSDCGSLDGTGDCPDSPDPAVVQTIKLTAPGADVKVTFDLAGGTRTGGGALVQTIPYGGDATPPTCTKTGATFNGWNGSYTNVTSNRTITAKWTTNSYTVNFDLAGGTRTGGGALTQTVQHGDDATPPTCTKVGSTFSGWDGSYTNITSDRTITAKWTIDSYTVTLDANGGTIYIPSEGDLPSYDLEKQHGVDLIIPDYICSKYDTSDPDGTSTSVFMGYATSPSGSVQYNIGDRYTQNQSITLYAIYDEDTYTVTFRDGYTEGDAGIIKQYTNVPRGSSVEPPPDPVRNGYTFSGWLGDYTNILSNQTIYALWGFVPIWIMKDGSWKEYTPKEDK